MAPPPTTTSFFGTSLKAMASSLETIVRPSNFMKRQLDGSRTGGDDEILGGEALREAGPLGATAPTSISLAETNDAAPG